MSEHLPECPKSGCPACYEQGQRDAIAAAVRRLEAIADDMNSGLDRNWDYEADPTGMTRNPRVWIREAVAAIKGDQP